MQKRLTLSWQFIFSLVLIAISAALYYEHFLIFHDAHHIWIYLLGDIAFIPIEVLLVTLVIHQLLKRRERGAMLYKLNMVIGAFFSEVGTPLLKQFISFDASLEDFRLKLIVSSQWKKTDYQKARAEIAAREFRIDILRSDVEGLRSFLIEKRGFLLGLLENQNLLEYESFTELLWAVFHLAEEVANRSEIKGSPEADLKHIELDVKRAYGLLIRSWLSYLEHLSRDYPYLFSFALRTNPFDKNASVRVEK